MTNEQILKKFVEGATTGKTNNLRIVGNLLYNYQTVIAERSETNGFALNRTKYSQTTSKIQSKIASILHNTKTIEIIDVPEGFGRSLFGLL